MDDYKIRGIVEKILVENNLFLVDVVIKGTDINQKVLVLADGDEGISIEQCSAVSRQLGRIIEEEDIITEKYTLEVSSPGLDFPLTINRQYKKNIGRTLTILLKDGSSVEGKLLKVNEEKIDLNIGAEGKTYFFSEIKQSKVKISFK